MQWAQNTHNSASVIVAPKVLQKGSPNRKIIFKAKKDAKMERGKERKKAHLKYRFFALKNVFLRVKMLKKYQKIA